MQSTTADLAALPPKIILGTGLPSTASLSLMHEGYMQIRYIAWPTCITLASLVLCARAVYKEAKLCLEFEKLAA